MWDRRVALDNATQRATFFPGTPSCTRHSSPPGLASLTQAALRTASRVQLGVPGSSAGGKAVHSVNRAVRSTSDGKAATRTDTLRERLVGPPSCTRQSSPPGLAGLTQSSAAHCQPSTTRRSQQQRQRKNRAPGQSAAGSTIDGNDTLRERLVGPPSCTRQSSPPGLPGVTQSSAAHCQPSTTRRSRECIWPALRSSAQWVYSASRDYG
ncbi:hypothetical protein SAMN05216210_1680 [Halopseudomonas salegens]|uniref:Uncharacterized protein n=1 Tax=Halopseudomonas salegens TaxID=1434072 RepID=A0A1H2FN25_9GAMM|nr:hypothetical protein SAMN05216210_1680 [Halopseudomonas salegens]